MFLIVHLGQSQALEDYDDDSQASAEDIVEAKVDNNEATSGPEDSEYIPSQEEEEDDEMQGNYD